LVGVRREIPFLLEVKQPPFFFLLIIEENLFDKHKYSANFPIEFG
jgi:hypothetical protein